MAGTVGRMNSAGKTLHAIDRLGFRGLQLHEALCGAGEGSVVADGQGFEITNNAGADLIRAVGIDGVWKRKIVAGENRKNDSGGGEIASEGEGEIVLAAVVHCGDGESATGVGEIRIETEKILKEVVEIVAVRVGVIGRVPRGGAHAEIVESPGFQRGGCGNRSCFDGDTGEGDSVIGV